MKTGKPTLVIETSPAGVKVVTIRVPRGQRAEGLTLLSHTLPAIRDLDRLARERHGKVGLAASAVRRKDLQPRRES